MAEKTDARALFDALGPAFDDVQAKTSARDDVAAKGQEATGRAQDALDTVREDADAKLKAANDDLAEATAALIGIQDKIAAIIGRAGDPNRIR